MPSGRLVRIHIALTPRQIRALDDLGKKLLLDRTNTMRLALARLVEEESRPKPPAISNVAQKHDL
ncbi:hypothetical protein GCM10011507_33380 [Edaphobacter acidisoli]|uniref:Uncharacterized protein n=1 Tax=Edaphobacter acidisoli TaxID=2040573 RepID=A0A916S215_9BACT|nr:hypothetical protein [Edaphobacter acidisoli]GGA79456.1 hypothetical protein GCM10011507_33380 [Edaphobacter acidisoli]